jgi:hypothetical protein
MDNGLRYISVKYTGSHFLMRRIKCVGLKSIKSIFKAFNKFWVVRFLKDVLFMGEPKFRLVSFDAELLKAL